MNAALTARVGSQLAAGSFEEALRTHKTPGLSLAVFEDDALAWTAAFGVRRSGLAEAVVPETLFQAASISKPISAVTALRLVEQGILDLDGDINERLHGWTVRDGSGAPARVTLRELLSHTAGLTVTGFPGYPRGADMPGIIEILDGVPPANTPAVRFAAGSPPRPFVYSGGGYTVIQHLIDCVTGSYEKAAGEVLARAGMIHSTFSQPSEAGAAFGHDASCGVLRAGWVLHPELAAAGLWATPTDLARFALALSQSYQGESDSLLQRASTTNAFSAVAEDDSAPFRWVGLGFFGAGEGERLRVHHTGGNQGYRCVLLIYPERGCGAAVMTNGDNGWQLLVEALRAIGDEFGWPQPDAESG